MDGVAKTAYYCCGVRAADAASAEPICGDQFARRFMTPEAQAIFAGFAGMTAPNASNVTRARIIDDWLRDELRAGANRLVILLGAGFDTRAYRLSGGRYVELDQPAVMAAKNAAITIAEAPNPLERVAIDFATEALASKLSPWAGEEPLVIMEGVSMYLEQAELRSTLAALRSLFPRHTLICDLMTARFRQRYGKAIHAEIVRLGGRFASLVEDPAAHVAAAGYRELARVSMVDRARQLGALRIPRFMLATLLKGLRDGYCVHRFEAR